MNRELPILFNTEMVRAILEGRKTVTRRVLKEPYYVEEIYDNGADKRRAVVIHKGKLETKEMPYPITEFEYPYQPGDVLYVRETWNHYNYENLSTGEHREGYFYKASPELKSTLPDYIQLYWGEKWRPSIHMPKEAARIWLKVTSVRVERLCSDIREIDCIKEGISPYKSDMTEKSEIEIEYEFEDLWNSTIKKSERNLYGWDANPWVFVYEFERIEHEQ